MRDTAIARGRKLIITIIAASVLSELFSLMINIAFGAAIPREPTIGRYVLTFIVCVFTYKGYDWARWLFILGGISAVLIGIYGLFVVFTRSPSIIGYVISLVGVSFGSFIAGTLMFSGSVSEFMEDRKAKRLQVAK